MAEQIYQIPPPQDDEISLKELIEKSVEYVKEIWKNKWWIILICIPIAAYFGYKAKMEVPTYSAQLTYTLNDGSSGVGGISGILGSFGLGKTGKVNLDKIIELSKSRMIIEQVLFSSITLDTFPGKEDFIANHIITLHELDKKWSEKMPEFTDFRFTTSNVDSFDLIDLRAFKMLHGEVVGGEGSKFQIFTNSYNDETGILTIGTQSYDEQLSIAFSNILFQKLKAYYIASNTSGNQNTFEFVQQKTDSIYQRMKNKEYQLSRFDDTHRNLVDPDLLTERKLLETEIFKLKTMYAEATKNFEIADFSLAAGKPDIIIIDEPLPPLDQVGKSWIMETIKIGLFAGIACIVFFVGRKVIIDAMKN